MILFPCAYFGIFPFIWKCQFVRTNIRFNIKTDPFLVCIYSCLCKFLFYIMLHPVVKIVSYRLLRDLKSNTSAIIFSQSFCAGCLSLCLCSVSATGFPFSCSIHTDQLKIILPGLLTFSCANFSHENHPFVKMGIKNTPC